VVVLAAAAVGIGMAAGVGPFSDAVRELTLPLRHEDIIRQQAAEKDLDAALIAAVIHQETGFRPRTSPAGAKGLMQITPDTARFIALNSGGTQFELDDLASPDINIRYGSWYLRHLSRRFDGDLTLAVAAYNAGAENVVRWVEEAGGADEFDPSKHIEFPETREYVSGVSKSRRDYREHYARELGL